MLTRPPFSRHVALFGIYKTLQSDSAKRLCLLPEGAGDAGPSLAFTSSRCASPSVLHIGRRLSLLEVSTCNFPRQISSLMNCNNLGPFKKKSCAVMLSLNCILHRDLDSVQFLFPICASVHPCSNYTVSHRSCQS